MSSAKWARRTAIAAAIGGLIGGFAVCQAANASWSSVTLERTSWAYVNSGRSNTAYPGGTGDAPIGRLHTDDGRNDVYRSFVTFDVRQLRGRQIGDVLLYTAETKAPDCVHRSVELWTTTPVTSATTWKHQPKWQKKLATAGYTAGSPCPFPQLAWDVSATLRQAVAAGRDELTLGLRESDERNTSSGRWLDNDMRIDVHFDTVPDTPTPQSTNGKPCGDETFWVSTAQPSLYASVSDPDNVEDGILRATFAVWPVDDPQRRTTLPVVAASNNYVAMVNLPPGVITDDGSYAWSAQVTDYQGFSSDWSTACAFNVDVTPPGDAPTVSSTDYPENGTSGGIGIPGTFTFAANGVNDVTGFLYGWGDTWKYVAADRLGGTATASIAPQRWLNMLYVRSVDRAGNPSPERQYRFYANSETPHIVRPGTAVDE